MIVLASLFGALSPFCSCGVVPLIAGLPGVGVPLAPVMAFWLSSPLIGGHPCLPEWLCRTAAGARTDRYGHSPAVALAFLVVGGVTSIPAATAVWALVKPRVFGLYLALAITGSLIAAYAYSAWLAVA